MNGTFPRFFTAVYVDYVTRHERQGPMHEELKTSRASNIKTAGLTLKLLAWCAIYIIARAALMLSILSEDWASGVEVGGWLVLGFATYWTAHTIVSFARFQVTADA